MPIRQLSERRLALVAVAFVLLLIFLWRSQLQPSTTLAYRVDHGGIRMPSLFGNATIPLASQNPPPAPTALGTGDPPPPESRLHLVIAHYDEEPFYIARWLTSLRAIPSIAALGLHVTIYTKGPNPDLEMVKTVSTADRVIPLPNVGREGSTYLHHILTNWDSLPEYTMFTQARLKKAQIEGSGPEAGTLQDWLTIRLKQHFVPSPVNGTATGFMSLDRKHDICHCGHCTDLGARDEFYPLWPQLFAMITGRVCVSREPSVLSFNGHFIVSRHRILVMPRRMYEYLQSLVDAPVGHSIHDEVEPRWFERRVGKSMPATPKFGHTLERLWHVIFDCARIEQVQDCDVTGEKAEGEGGCSCVDTVKT